MRSRTVREGSVGLVILLALGTLAGLFLWLRGFSPARRSYSVTIRFPNVQGMQVGAPVLYRGVSAGKISAIRVSANYAEVDVRISPATIVMPRDLTVVTTQSGLVGETYIDMTPNKQLTDAAAASNPLAADCDESLIVCNGTFLQGDTSVTFTELISSMINFTNTFSNPEFFGELRTLTRNFASAAEGIDTLSGEVTTLSQSVRSELGTLSDSASRSTASIGSAADQFGLTAAELRGLVADNRSTLVTTLDNINQTVVGVQSIVNGLAPVMQTGEFASNLQTLSANAVEASANLRTLSGAVGSAENILLLQQTLDSARATFQNAQKITADLDDLTGDPAFRENIRRLVNGLGGLVSSAQQLQQETQLAQALYSAQVAAQSPAPTDHPDHAAEPEPAAQPKSNAKPAEQPEPPDIHSTEHSTEHANPRPEPAAGAMSVPVLPNSMRRLPRLDGTARDLQLPNQGLRQLRE